MIEELFEKWFKSYLRANYLVECDFGQSNLPKSIARQCAEAAFLAGWKARKVMDVEIAKDYRKTRPISWCDEDIKDAIRDEGRYIADAIKEAE